MLFPTLAVAGEAELACSLERSVAEVQATVVGSPAAFASLGDSSTSEQYLTAGVSHSVSGYVRASQVRDAASARCEVIRANVLLDKHGRWATAGVKRAAALAQLNSIEQALTIARANLTSLDAQLASQLITLAQHTEARMTLASLERTQAELLRLIAVPVPQVEPQKLADLVESSRRHEARAARLAASAQAQTGWDVVISAGARQPVSGAGNASPFASVAVKYSFGADASAQAAQAVGKYTEAFLESQHGGYTQVAVRHRQELEALIEVETLASGNAGRQLTHLQRVRATVVGIDTSSAVNLVRSLDVQLLGLKAELTGAESRLSGYRKLLERFK